MPKRKSTFREYLEALLVAGVFLGFTNTFVVKTFYIPSSSMEDTLLVGDHLFVNRFIFGSGAPRAGGAGSGDDATGGVPQRPVRRGDIVVFRSPVEPTMDLIKRAVAVPGDVVELRGKTLYVNGEPVAESYAIHRDARVYPDRPGIQETYRKRDNFGPVTVPAGHYFCLGDNRDNSYDSRYWGFVPEELLAGRAVMIYWSYAGPTSDGRWHGAAAAVTRIARTLVTFPTRTRWDRTFQLIR